LKNYFIIGNIRVTLGVKAQGFLCPAYSEHANPSRQVPLILTILQLAPSQDPRCKPETRASHKGPALSGGFAKCCAKRGGVFPCKKIFKKIFWNFKRAVIHIAEIPAENVREMEFVASLG
jgi:hypothetical protein